MLLYRCFCTDGFVQMHYARVTLLSVMYAVRDGDRVRTPSSSRWARGKIFLLCDFPIFAWGLLDPLWRRTVRVAACSWARRRVSRRRAMCELTYSGLYGVVPSLTPYRCIHMHFHVSVISVWAIGGSMLLSSPRDITAKSARRLCAMGGTCCDVRAHSLRMGSHMGCSLGQVTRWSLCSL